MQFRDYVNEEIKLTGTQAATKVKQALEKSGLGRTSSYDGGKITGWTNNLGSTGFSVRKDRDGKLDWHVVISGKKHLPYEDYEERRDGDTYTLHRPVNPQSLEPKIKKVFQSLKLKVLKVRYSGHQAMWDDDVTYNITTERPTWLSDKN